MEVLRVDGFSPDAAVLERALALLRQGGLIVYPTDTLYAFGGHGLNETAVRRVIAAKQRPPDKPLPLVASDLSQLRGLCSASPPALGRLAERFWPGPLTVVLPASPSVPSALTAGSGTVAVRIPALPLARALCRDGPLVSTSANLSGGRPPATCAEAVAAVGGSAELALDAGPGREAPSTIVDLTGVPRLVRAGAVAWQEIEGVLRAEPTVRE